MDHLDDLHRRIRASKIDGALRVEIADKIQHLIEQQNYSVSPFHKMRFVQAVAEAISGLTENVASISQTTDAGLDKCLTALRQAIATIQEPDVSYSRSESSCWLFAYESLLAAIENIRRQIIQTAPNKPVAP